MRISPLAIAILCSALSAQANADVGRSFDKFTGRTSWIADEKPERPKGEMSPQVLLVLDKNGAFREAAILLHGTFDGWRYLKCNSTHWLLDGKAITLNPSKYDGDVISGGTVYESVAQPLSKAQFMRFASAAEIEFQVCGDDSSFTVDDVLDFQELVEKLK